MTDIIRHTAELARIKALPRRDVNADQVFTERLIEELTEALKTPAGMMRLRAIQAHALHDIGTHGGGFFPIGVGEGKTLISLMAAWLLDSVRSILLLPAGLIEKTVRDRDRLLPHWMIPHSLRLFSYEMLGRVQAADELETWAPDLIICDEVQRLKNPDAAVTRRVDRYMASHPSTRFVALSGTIMDRSLLEFGHILRWCLKGDASPIPKEDHEYTEWALAIDEKVESDRRYKAGALLSLIDGLKDDGAVDITRARRAFQRRLVETPGVVATTGDGESVKCAIHVRAITYPMRPITDAHLHRLRSEMKTPDEDWDVEPVDVWRHARELALGFHQVWDPRPPDEWCEARSAWFSYVRRVLSRTDTLDSPQHVEFAILSGEIRGEGAELLAAWRAIEPTFIPNPVPVWHDDSALKVAAKWVSKKGPAGIVWTEHLPFAERLAEVTGASYFGAKGLDAAGTFIEDAPAGETIIASIDANREGLNLQWKWSRNLFVSPEESPSRWQQSIARTHRPGQAADEVTVDIFLGCLEHVRAWRGALAGAAAVHQTTGAQQKLLLADILDWPSDFEIESFSGARWRVPMIPKFEIPV